MIDREGIYDSFIREMNSQDYGGTKPHSRPSTSWRPGDVGSMAKSTSKTLRIRKVNGVILRWILKAREAGWGWSSTGISPGVPGPDSLEFWCSRAEEEEHPSSRREKNLFSPTLFYPGPQLIWWYLEDKSSILSSTTHMPVPSGTPSQTHPEVMLYRFSRYSFILSCWQLKWTVTGSYNSLNSCLFLSPSVIKG